MKLHNGQESIKIGFTDKKLSPHAGSAVFWAWARPSGFIEVLKDLLPHPQPTSNNHITPLDKALGFIQGILCAAEKLTQVAHLRRDPVLPEIMGIKRIASQSVLSRFFAKFDSEAKNQHCFGKAFEWCIKKLKPRKGGFSLDFDSTRLLHEDGHQEGVVTGYTRVGIKPCLHPLLAFLEEPKMVVGIWLRPGNTQCSNNIVNFTHDVFSRFPSWLNIRVVRADSGFCDNVWLEMLEDRNQSYIVVAKLLKPVKKLITSGLDWQPTKVRGTTVAEVMHKEQGWKKPRRLVIIRHEIKEKKRPGGKALIEVPGYLFQGLVTNQPARVSAIDLWLDYNGRAGCECVIKELDEGYALPKLILKKFWATEAALSLAVMSYNLIVLFQQKLGWLDRVTLKTLRYWFFVTAGSLGNHAGKKEIKLSLPPGWRAWWEKVWAKITSPYVNCNAVGHAPTQSAA
jgi:Transposase DDE domain group 1